MLAVSSVKLMVYSLVISAASLYLYQALPWHSCGVEDFSDVILASCV